ncbi:MAG: hypothetical protein K2G20_03075 [Lachnospiraceae bacterium]|nr:hypothetical protein [Lachnospiraceae bacterium]
MELMLKGKWTCFLESAGVYDVLPVVLSHVETVVLFPQSDDISGDLPQG